MGRYLDLVKTVPETSTHEAHNSFPWNTRVEPLVPAGLDENSRDASTTLTTETTKAPSLADLVLALPLSQFQQRHLSLEIGVAELSDSLWFVSGSEEADKLQREGVKRGRIWTAAELIDLCKGPAPTYEDVIRVARAKLMFSAEVVDVRRDVSEDRSAADPGPTQSSLDLGVEPQREFD